MSARDDYPPKLTNHEAELAQWRAMCDEIDQLREQLLLVSEELLHPKELTVDQHGVLQAVRQDRWQQALDSMAERQVPTVLREFRSSKGVF